METKPKWISISDIYDFYTLYAMKTELETETPGMHKGIDKLYEDVCQNFNALVDALYPALGQYLYMAAFAEARHANGRCHYYIEDVCSKGYSREQASKAAVRYQPIPTLDKLVELFGYSWGGGSFGGKKWKNIAEAGRKFFTKELPPIVYIDHVVSIQHNGGMAFSKSSSARLSRLDLSDYGQFNYYLNERSKNVDILNPKTNAVIKSGLHQMRAPALYLLRRHWLLYREKDTPCLWIDAIISNYKKEENTWKYPDPYYIQFKDEEVGEIKSAIAEKVKAKVPVQHQNQGLGVYDEFKQQCGEKDREGKVLAKPEPIVQPKMGAVPHGKYIVIDLSQW